MVITKLLYEIAVFFANCVKNEVLNRKFLQEM
jgi:hypothetical protein